MDTFSPTTITGQTISGPLLLVPKIFEDERGYFFESWNQIIWQKILEKHNQPYQPFVQDNQSFSKKGVLRGLHYQINPHSQGKLVRCLTGEIYDVAVDIRCSSSTFGKWVGVHLSSANKNQLWIPSGFAHGFLVLSNSAEVLYKTTDFWNSNSERSLLWNDPSLKIFWPDSAETIQLSQKDSEARLLADIPFEEVFP